MSGVARFRQSALLSLFLLVCFEFCARHASGQCGTGGQDRQDKLALYKVILRTYWSRARFPRHYPEWRPPAQFGKLVGRTHDATYTLYRLGERLTPGGTLYVETGKTDGLDTGGDSWNVLNAFTGPPIPQGEGSSVARAFLDGNRTLVSIMVRINPSPDWFIGVDSFQLCAEGNWVDTVTVELDPLDGGTDNGFTFTAANWPTRPQGIAYRITSRYPAHPAGSFYYPILPRLPPIATLTFTKLKEYSLTETYHENELGVEFVSNASQRDGSPATPRGIDPNRELNEAIAEERREMDTRMYRYWTTASGHEEEQGVTREPRDDEKEAASMLNGAASPYSMPRSESRRSENEIHREVRKDTAEEAGTSSGEKLDSERVLDEGARIREGNSTGVRDHHRRRGTWNSETPVTKKHQHKLRMKHQRRSQSKGNHPRSRPARDCKVGDWGPWSACSRSCGIGETRRTRGIRQSARRGGATCPPLTETKWCGSASPCPPQAAAATNPYSGKPDIDLFQW